MQDKVQKIDKEIEKLRLLQSKLIKQREIYILKLEASGLPKAKQKSKLSVFEDKYYDYRLKIGLKWKALINKKIELIGRPTTLKNFDENQLDKEFKDV